jgi:pimeloyl-ACP methyl ester carboxylesterase
MPTPRGRLLTAATVGALLAATVAVPAQAAPRAAAASQPAAATTSAREKKRVDSVPTPKLAWYGCFGGAQCATVRLPLDYDQPKGATTELAVVRIKAKDPAHRIGSLFVNPGGPGGSATSMALGAPYFLSDSVLKRFDVIGVDPRGIGASANVKCFKSVRDQTLALANLTGAFPYGAKQEKSFTTSLTSLAKGCSTTGKPLSGAMSTAEVARDMDVLRRAVGDRKLTYLGFSYGTAIGQYYADMFPDRFRAIAVDGVIDPVTWAGTDKTRNLFLDERMHSADGAYRALVEVLKRCAKAGPKYCAFSAGDPVRNFDVIAQKLRAKPLVVDDPDLGTYTITYADFVAGTLGSLYDQSAGDNVTQFAAQLWQLLFPPAPANATARAAAVSAVVGRVTEARRKLGFDFPYDNSLEAFSGVTCTDGLHPQHVSAAPAAAAKADKRAPYFGRAWMWSSVQCARDIWSVQDEDAYRGPFNVRTQAPVLIVGTHWDPATNYDSAVSASKRLPNSRLLSNLNWGHTSYGTSACATNAMDDYLLTVTLPKAGTTCVGDVQPFTTPIDQPAPPTQTLRADGSKRLPPVSGWAPGTIRVG